MMEFLWELACQLHPAVEVCHLARTEGERLLTSEETFKMTERISKAERLLGRKVNETIGNLTSNVPSVQGDWRRGFPGRKCYRCQRMGHIASMCRN
jgi:hypothetical protein